MACLALHRAGKASQLEASSLEGEQVAKHIGDRVPGWSETPPSSMGGQGHLTWVDRGPSLHLLPLRGAFEGRQLCTMRALGLSGHGQGPQREAQASLAGCHCSLRPAWPCFRAARVLLQVCGAISAG